MITVMSVKPDAVYLMADFNNPGTVWESKHTESDLKVELLDTTAALVLDRMIDMQIYRTSTSSNR